MVAGSSKLRFLIGTPIKVLMIATTIKVVFFKRIAGGFGLRGVREWLLTIVF